MVKYLLDDSFKPLLSGVLNLKSVTKWIAYDINYKSNVSFI